jgi:protein involved in sex pheromone biosynthesis
MKKITILISAISLFLFSCGNTSNEKSKEQTETVTHEEHQHDDESANHRTQQWRKMES